MRQTEGDPQRHIVIGVVQQEERCDGRTSVDMKDPIPDRGLGTGDSISQHGSRLEWTLRL